LTCALGLPGCKHSQEELGTGLGDGETDRLVNWNVRYTVFNHFLTKIEFAVINMMLMHAHCLLLGRMHLITEVVTPAPGVATIFHIVRLVHKVPTLHT
jgi:hypothetical protein